MRRSAARLAYAGVLGSPLLVLGLFLVPGGPAMGAAQALHGLAMVTALVLMVRAIRTGDDAMRRPRQLFAAALSCTIAANLIVLGYVVVGATVPSPSIADPISMVWIPLAVAGFWIVPGRGAARASSVRIAADAAVIGSSVLLISWTLVLGPISHTTGWSALERLTQLAYPIGDGLVVALVIALLPRARTDLRVMLNWAAVGLVGVAVADSASVLSASRHGTLRFGWADVALQIGIACIVVSAQVQSDGSTTEDNTAWLDHYLPYLPVLVAVPIGLAHVAEQRVLQFGAAAPLRIMVLVLIIRQVLYTRELSALVKQHRQDARHDALTGLSNRFALLDRLQVVLGVPDPGPIALLLVDLDGFKEINDNYGHDHGDGVLRAFGAVVSGLTGEGTMVARLGGDEFAVLVTGPDAAAQATRIGRELGSWRRVSCLDGADIQLLASVGMTIVQDGDAPVDVLRRADLAMYDAKRSRALPRYTAFRPELEVLVQRRNLLAADLSTAIDRHELHLAYQPIFGLHDARIIGAEALLRWEHPHFGTVPPDEFISLAEENGEIVALGAWVLEQAVSQVARWEAEGMRLPQLFVNVSARQFTAALPDLVAGVLGRHGLSPDRLTLEVTESQAPDLAGSLPMQDLRATGVRLALDDFGAGYSTFAQLSRLPVDVLKIDREFVTDLDTMTGRRIIEAIAGLAASLSMQTVVEGIEDAAQAQAVRDAGVDLGQGYHFSRPLPAAGMGDLLRRTPHPVPGPRTPIALHVAR